MLKIGIGHVARGAITMLPGIGTETHTLPVPHYAQTWNLGALVRRRRRRATPTLFFYRRAGSVCMYLLMMPSITSSAPPAMEPRRPSR